jgi:biopolymer transport protein ExbD
VKLERNYTISPALFSVVPLINVLFLVVIFFALSSRFVLQSGMAVTLPVSPFTLGPQRVAQIVSVTAAPVPAIYFQDQKVTLEELRAQLEAHAAGPRTLIVKADRSTPYDVAVQIMNEGLKLGWSVVLAASPERP